MSSSVHIIVGTARQLKVILWASVVSRPTNRDPFAIRGGNNLTMDRESRTTDCFVRSNDLHSRVIPRVREPSSSQVTIEDYDERFGIVPPNSSTHGNQFQTAHPTGMQEAYISSHSSLTGWRVAVSGSMATNLASLVNPGSSDPAPAFSTPGHSLSLTSNPAYVHEFLTQQRPHWPAAFPWVDGEQRSSSASPNDYTLGPEPLAGGDVLPIRGHGTPSNQRISGNSPAQVAFVFPHGPPPTSSSSLQSFPTQGRISPNPTEPQRGNTFMYTRLESWHIFAPPHAHRPTWGARLSKSILTAPFTPEERTEFIEELHLTIHTANQDPSTLVIYTDGSRRKGQEGALVLADHLLFLSDNQAALKSIDDVSDHPSQCASIIFQKHIDNFLTNPSHDVSLSWVPGHNGFQGNEADSLAKEAVNLRPPILHSTVSWALERAKARSLKLWHQDWLHLPHTNLAAVGLHKPPSLKLAKFHKEYGGPATSTHASSKPSLAMDSSAPTTTTSSPTSPPG
ncbi:hypothetical protein BU17DRAFT_104149 [Hysterangium stoloniferum]|nr:hypothetical protein BU17DRAFT_104149 [Hysterangium stoloniferum]